MRRLHEKQIRVLEYEYSPLMEVQGWSEVPRGTPLFETNYVFQNYPLDAGIRERAGSSLHVSEIQYFSRNSYKLAIHALPGKELHLIATYHDGRHEASGIEQLLKRLDRVLEGMAGDEKGKVIDVPMISEQERHQIVVEWNQTAAEYPRVKCVHELFEEQVEKSPEAVALVYEDEQVSYDELNRRANQLAHHLRERGVGAEVKVGLCVERSLEMIVGLLGVMKAGGAYLPLDPSYPLERLAYMIEDSGCPVIVTTRYLLEKLPVTWAQIVKIDDDWPAIARESQDNPELITVPENLVYIIYTSGSTGRPKGVLVSHRNLRDSTLARLNYYEETVRSYLLLSSFSFDSSVAGIFWPLIEGGAIVVPSETTQRDLQEVVRTISNNQVSHLLALPSLYGQILKAGTSESLASLSVVIVAGEECHKSILSQHQNRATRCHLVNEYGPTEVTVWSTVWKWGGVDLEERIPIGRPIESTRVYATDEGLGLAPIGVSGELYIGGEKVSRGYLNDAAKTAERFVPDGISGEEGERLYSTGDRVRWRWDGELEFLGRLDQQVKLRGYRIELGEIEAAINEHPSVEQAIVLAREDEPGAKRLVGYIVGRQQVTSQQIREYLQARLPDYMLPGAVVRLEKMPLTPNGKIDRRALPKPEMGKESRQYVGPRTAVEEILCGIWMQVLKAGRISILDNFFALGGDSLRVMEAISLGKDAGLELTPRQFFESQTLIELAQHCQGSSEDSSESGKALLVPARINGSKAPLFFAHPAGGGVDFLWTIAHHLEPDQPIYGFRFKGLSLTEIYKPDLEEVAADYIDLMKSVQPRGPYLIGGMSLGVYIAFEMARQLQNRGEAVSLLAMFDAGPVQAEGMPDIVARFPIDLAKAHADDISPEEITAIDPGKRLDYVLKRIKSVRSNHDYSQIARIAPAWYGHLLSVERYLSKVMADPQSYLYTGKITLFTTGEGHDEGWSTLSSQKVDINVLSGSHGTMFTGPQAGTNARMLTRAILKSELKPLINITS
jgi:amino acid adenylation domain-containing protein